MTEEGEKTIKEIERGGRWGHYAVDKIVMALLIITNLIVNKMSGDSAVSFFVLFGSFVVYGITRAYGANFYGTNYTITDRRIMSVSNKPIVPLPEIKGLKTWVYYKDIADVSVVRTWLDWILDTGTIVLVFEDYKIDFFGIKRPELPKSRKKLLIIHVDNPEEIARYIKIASEKARKEGKTDDEQSLPWTEIPSFKEIAAFILVLVAGAIFLIWISRIDFN